MGVICFNPDRIQGGLAIIEKYKDPDTGIIDTNNPDYIAELNTHNQKYDNLEKDVNYVEGIKTKIEENNKKIIEQQQQQQQQEQEQQQTTTQDTGALANVGTEEDVGGLANVLSEATKNYAYLTSDTGAKTIGGGKTFVYMTDENTGQQYVYRRDPGDDEGFQNNIAPPEGANLKIGTVLSKTGSDGEWERSEPENLYFGGGVDPETAANRTAEAQKDDKSDNDVYYDVTDSEGNTTTYIDVTGTGESIPVGATNITRDPTGGKGQPNLIKGFSGYHTTQESADKDTIPESTTSFTEALTSPFVEGGQGSGVFDLGSYFGLNKDQLTLMNPDANQFDLNKFFNQTESFGTQNFLRSQSTDVLNDIIMQGNFFDALAGKNFKLADGSFYYDKIYNVINDKIKDPNDLSRYGVDPSRGYGTPDDPLRLDEFGGFNEVTGLGGGAIQGYDVNQAQSFLDSLGETLGTGDRIYSNTAYGADQFNITGSDDSNALQYDYAYSQRPLTAQAVRAYKGGLGPYANVQYLTRYGYTPEIGDEILRYDEASGVYFDPVTNLPINPEMLEGFALGDPETVELGGTEDVYRGQMTTDPITGEQLYYDADGNPVTQEQYQTFTEPMGTGVT